MPASAASAGLLVAESLFNVCRRDHAAVSDHHHPRFMLLIGAGRSSPAR